jgi:hypothetical protein
MYGHAFMSISLRDHLIQKYSLPQIFLFSPDYTGD